MFAKKPLYALACLSLGTALLISLSTTAQAVPTFSVPPPPRSASTNPPPGYEGALDHLRPVFPIWRPPLADPVGLALNAAGTHAYVIEKGLHRLSWVDIDPASPTCTAVTPITDVRLRLVHLPRGSDDRRRGFSPPSPPRSRGSVTACPGFQTCAGPENPL